MLLLAAAGALTVAAKPLTPEAALSRAMGSPQHASIRGRLASATPQLALTVNTAVNTPGVYVFDTGRNGYILVSADDCAAPILGYSDSGEFNPSQMPPQLKGWLDFYARQIEWGAKKGMAYAAASAPADASWSSVTPMVKTKWDQGAPYNDDCPMDNGARSVTGCVATAMAQAMYFHQWPAKGTGSKSYTWNGQTLSMNFANTPFDWSDMTLTYDSSSSTQAKSAVATLMYACGISVEMDYTSDESGASSMDMVQALYKYFDYDKSMTYPQRSYYGTLEWEGMVYDQLSRGLPVLYSGESNEGGHQFICDGYDGDGYFHFNWGWSGMSDGYYLLTALDPLDQGIGGTASDEGFNYDQGIVLNMMPAKADSSVTPLIYCYGNFSVKSQTVSLGSQADFDTDYFNFGCSDVKGYMGIKLTASDGSVSYISHAAELSFGSFSGYGGFSVTLPSALGAGSYTVTPVFRMDGTDTWTDVPCPLSGIQALTMTVSGGQASFSDKITNQISVTDFTINTPIYLGENFSTTFTLTNTGTTEYYGEYLMYLLNSQGEAVAPSNDIGTIDLQPGESTTVTYISTFPTEVETESGESTVSPGTYYLCLATHFSQLILYTDQTPVNVQAAPANTAVSVVSFSVNDGKPVSNAADVKFSGVAECTEGYFSGRLKVAVFKSGTSSTTLSANTGYLFMSAGQESSFEAHADVSAEDAVSFFAVVFDGSKQLTNGYTFTLAPDGVVSPVSDGGIIVAVGPEALAVTSESGVASAKIYSIDGTLVGEYSGGGDTRLDIPTSDLGHGEYVVTVTDASGATCVKLFIR